MLSSKEKIWTGRGGEGTKENCEIVSQYDLYPHLKNIKKKTLLP